MRAASFRSAVCVLALSGLVVVGCAGSPPPRPIYEDTITSVRLQVDERTSTPHTHPAQISAEQMAAILNRVRVVPRKGFVQTIIGGQSQASPAFSQMEAHALAAPISRALAEAKPEEMVTFYRRFSDQSVGLAMTSGGLFVQDGQLYFILANNRNQPTDGMNENSVSAIDPLQSPLLPISRTAFRIAYPSATAVIPADERRPWPYVDEGRVLTLDLAQLARELKPTEPLAPATAK